VRICLLGKFPPIQGGVSMRTYRNAHALAASGHEVHVVTNAKEVAAPFRMHMRPQDWQRCEASYGGGSVTVHWTDPVDRSQSYIPSASPFVSKLAGIAARLHAERPFDVIYSFYLEPYGVAAHLVAEMTRVPHVVRMAGSDAGKLWRHPQLEALYDHVLRSAEAVITGGAVARYAVARGIDPARIAFDGGIVVPDDVFSPKGPVLDLAGLRAEVNEASNLRDLMWGDFDGARPYFGIYGKLGERKGSFALLAALSRLKREGIDVGLVALAHGQPAVEKAFRARARALKLQDRILQLPFLPHWRVPEFLRGCLAVCCLEQGFPITFHMPIIPREVLLAGTCLVGSTEVLRKLPGHGRLIHGYGCIAMNDVTDTAALARQLAALATDPGPRSAVGQRGRIFAQELQEGIAFPQRLEQILGAAAARRSAGAVRCGDAVIKERSISENGRFPLTRLAMEVLARDGGRDRGGDRFPTLHESVDLPRARQFLAAVEHAIGRGDERAPPLLAPVVAEIAVATAEDDIEATPAPDFDPLFRLHMKRWAVDDDDLLALFPVRDPRVRLIEFDIDVSIYLTMPATDCLSKTPAPGRSFLVAFAQSDGERRGPLLVEERTAEILVLCDGTHTVSEVFEHCDRHRPGFDQDARRRCIAQLLTSGLVSLHDERIDPPAAPRPLARIEVRSASPIGVDA
jgi:glycosyltransferase involved in cell wall biosynthesis